MSDAQLQNVIVRLASPNDVQVVAEYNAALAKESENRELHLPTLTTGVGQALSNPAYGRYYLAEVDGNVIGQVLLTFEWSDWRNGQFWWIQSVYVHPNFRRGGVFRALYQFLREEAKKDPVVCGLRLYVEEDNARAKQTYKAMGMQPTGYELFEEDWSDDER